MKTDTVKRHIITVAGVLLAVVASYFVKEFTAQVVGKDAWLVPWLSACSLVGTYCGLAFADIPTEQQHKVKYVAGAAMFIEASYGTLYVLSLQHPGWFVGLEWYAAVPLAALHGAPFTVLLFLVSLFVTHRTTGTTTLDALRQQVTTLTAARDEAMSERDTWRQTALNVERQLSDMEATQRQAARQLTDTTDRVELPAPTKPTTKKERIARLARHEGVSERTIERRIDKGLITLPEV